MRRRDENKLRDSKRRVLVEAAEDLHAITELIRKREPSYKGGATWPFFEAGDGFPSCLKELPVLLANSDRYDRIGIIIDADFDFQARSQSLSKELQRLGVDQDVPPGSITELPTGQRLGVWIFPDNRHPGEVENFLRPALREDGKLWPWAQEAVQTAIEAKAAPTRNRLKSELRTWLAWQQDPGISYGTAVAQGLFDADDPTLDKFVLWFTTLFPTS